MQYAWRLYTVYMYTFYFQGPLSSFLNSSPAPVFQQQFSSFWGDQTPLSLYLKSTFSGANSSLNWCPFNWQEGALFAEATQFQDLGFRRSVWHVNLKFMVVHVQLLRTKIQHAHVPKLWQLVDSTRKQSWINCEQCQHVPKNAVGTFPKIRPLVGDGFPEWIGGWEGQVHKLLSLLRNWNYSQL